MSTEPVPEDDANRTTSKTTDSLPATSASHANLSETQDTSIIKHSLEKENGDDNAINDNNEDEEAACCLCHCGVDCSDRALFFPKDRKQELEEDEDYYFSMEDPFFPETLYDQNNALVYLIKQYRPFQVISQMPYQYVISSTYCKYWIIVLMIAQVQVMILLLLAAVTGLPVVAS